jgi:hypothetical protein
MYHLTRDAYRSTYLDEIERELLASPYMGESPLGPEFVNTHGFSLVFRRTALDSVFAAWPYLRVFLEQAIFPKSNAFYVNPLVLAAQSRVDPHVDCRLVASENVRIIPTLVSVLYVVCDAEMEGGELVLNVGTPQELALKPSRKDLLHFRGNIIHCVREVTRPCSRISVVYEQYNLPEKILLGFPSFRSSRMRISHREYRR